MSRVVGLAAIQFACVKDAVANATKAEEFVRKAAKKVMFPSEFAVFRPGHSQKVTLRKSHYRLHTGPMPMLEPSHFHSFSPTAETSRPHSSS